MRRRLRPLVVPLEPRRRGHGPPGPARGPRRRRSPPAPPTSTVGEPTTVAPPARSASRLPAVVRRHPGRGTLRPHRAAPRRRAPRRRTRRGQPAETGRWISPWVEPGFDLTELVPSWRAATPGASSIEVAVRGRDGSRRSSWDTISVWAKGDEHVKRTSGSAQTDDLGRVLYDTWLADDLPAWQVRVTLQPTQRRGRLAAGEDRRRHGLAAARRSAACATSNPGAQNGARRSGTTLPVPRYSQMVHRGSYTQYGGGGEAWCSPTSLTMVLAYYDALPAALDVLLGARRPPRPRGGPGRARDLRHVVRRHRARGRSTPPTRRRRPGRRS